MPRSNPPRVYRILIQAKDLDRSRRFYESLLGTRGRSVGGERIYFDCGPVILGILDGSGVSDEERSIPTEAIYLATNDLDGVHQRASRLGCLSKELIHNDPANPAGRMVVRPWGERSFYVFDPSGNPLCFVDERTLFTGTPRQAAALMRATTSRSGGRPSDRAHRSAPRQRSKRRTGKS
jgi:catechol 2,3-dioxygenase-like lactoylglutathione lyase family enzyme